MKILIAYDGSDCANAAIDDLSRAGLPDNIEALVITVTETWLPAKEDYYVQIESGEPDWIWRKAAKKEVAKCEKLSEVAARKISGNFPSWQVDHKLVGGFPEWAVVAQANKFEPDLIVVGSQGRNAVGRMVLGSVSLKVLSEAACSVRVTRRSFEKNGDEKSPQRLVIGIDGSPDSQAAVEEVAKRFWLPKSEALLVTVIEQDIDSVYEDFSKFETELKKAEELRKTAAEQLEKSSLRVSTVVKTGRAKKILVQEAENWDADCIFLGAKGHRFLERILLGSVSYAVTARAHCTVEVVRGN